MAFWLVRAGRHGEEEQAALEHNVATIAWNELPDLSNIKD
jgi:restriction system protein